MRHIRVIICEVDDETPNTMTELAAFDLLTADPTTMQSDTALDDLERTTDETGQAILLHTLQARWHLVDDTLVEQYRQAFSPSTPVRRTRRRPGG